MVIRVRPFRREWLLWFLALRLNGAKDMTTMTQHDDSANQAHDDAAPTEGHTMAKYAAWHTRNCNCIPADTDAAEARRDNHQGEDLA
jgi:hypothetical protein